MFCLFFFHQIWVVLMIGRPKLKLGAEINFRKNFFQSPLIWAIRLDRLPKSIFQKNHNSPLHPWLPPPLTAMVSAALGSPRTNSDKFFICSSFVADAIAAAFAHASPYPAFCHDLSAFSLAANKLTAASRPDLHEEVLGLQTSFLLLHQVSPPPPHRPHLRRHGPLTAKSLFALLGRGRCWCHGRERNKEEGWRRRERGHRVGTDVAAGMGKSAGTS